MIEPHVFKPVFWQGSRMLRCDKCAMFETHAIHTGTLPGMENADRDRETAASVAMAEELTLTMRTPKADVSRKAGRMERESPLFFGTGDQPSLF